MVQIFRAASSVRFVIHIKIQIARDKLRWSCSFIQRWPGFLPVFSCSQQHRRLVHPCEPVAPPLTSLHPFPSAPSRLDLVRRLVNQSWWSRTYWAYSIAKLPSADRRMHQNPFVFALCLQEPSSGVLGCTSAEDVSKLEDACTWQSGCTLKISSSVGVTYQTRAGPPMQRKAPLLRN